MKINPDTYLLIAGVNTLPKKNNLAGWQITDVTDKQKEMLDKIGVAYARIKYKGQASIVIDTYMTRQHAGLATPKQLAVLLDNGIPAIEIAKFTRKEASDRIRQLYQVVV